MTPARHDAREPAAPRGGPPRLGGARRSSPRSAKSPERPGLFAGSGGAPVERAATRPRDPRRLDYLRDLGFPGEFPYTRGVQPTMYRGRLWTMRQYAGFGSAAETNQRFRYLLEQGQSGLSRGLRPADPDGLRRRPRDGARARSGKVGVAISSVRGHGGALRRRIPLDRVSTSMTINATASILLVPVHRGGGAQGVPVGQALRAPSRTTS